jgi:hypothetical protein
MVTNDLAGAVHWPSCNPGARAQPLLLGAMLFVWLVVGGAVINRLVAG